MKFILSNTYDLQHDIMHYLNSYYNGIIPFNYDTLRKEVYLTMPQEVLETKLAFHDPFFAIAEKIERDALTEFLFKSLDNLPSAFPAKLVNISEEKMLERISHAINTSFSTLEEFKSWIFESSLSDYDKYRLSVVANDQHMVEKYLEEFFSRNNELVQELESLYSKTYPKYVENFDLNALETFLEAHKLDFPENTEYTVYLSPLVPISVIVNASNEENGIYPVKVHLSPNTLEIIALSEDTQDEQARFIEAAKILSEPKKLEILKLCLDEALYGTELAKALGLSGATISHHVASLLENGFLSVTMKQNKVYYRTNPKTIRDSMRLVETLFAKTN